MSAAHTWSAIAVITVASTAGDVFLARGMKRIGDFGAHFSREGLAAVLRRVFASGYFLAGVGCMAVAFFSLLAALSWADVSLVAPAAASLSYISNALAAKLFLKERVDRRRWAAAALVAGGVALLAV